MGRVSCGLDGRSDPLVTQRALAATWDLLSTKGYSALRIDDIATSCGIAKTTLYRRWPSLAHIVVDAVVSESATAHSHRRTIRSRTYELSPPCSCSPSMREKIHG